MQKNPESAAERLAMARAFGQRLRARRRDLGLTIAALCRRTEVTLSYIIDIEHGRATPSLAVMIKLAGAVKCRMDELLGPVDDVQDDSAEERVTRETEAIEISAAERAIVECVRECIRVVRDGIVQRDPMDEGEVRSENAQ